MLAKKYQRARASDQLCELAVVVLSIAQYFERKTLETEMIRNAFQHAWHLPEAIPTNLIVHKNVDILSLQGGIPPSIRVDSNWPHHYLVAAGASVQLGCPLAGLD